MKIVTGHRNVSHITSNDMQAFYRGTIGEDNYILDIGNCFGAELETNGAGVTTVSVKDGEGVMQGVHFRIEPGEVETVTLDVGTIDQVRYDIICARYTKDVSTGIESVDLVVIKGENGGDIPTFIEGDIVGGDLTADAPLIIIKLDGFNASFENYKVPRVLTSTAGLYDEIRREDLLYTNPNVDAEMGSYNVTIDGSNYDYVDVVYVCTSAFDIANRHKTVVRHVKGSTNPLSDQMTQAIMIDIGTNFRISKRDVIVSNDKVRFYGASTATFSDGAWSVESDDTVLIPQYIYGGRW